MRQICPVCGIGYAGPKTKTTCGRHRRKRPSTARPHIRERRTAERKAAAQAETQGRYRSIIDYDDWLKQEVH